MATSSQEQPLSLPQRPRVIYAGQKKDYTLWNKHKDTFRLLYLTRDHKLEDVKKQMETEHGFPTTPLNDYETVLRNHFQFRKNVRSSDWASIGHRIEKRKLAGKASNVYLCGQLMPPRKPKKEISRHGPKGVSRPQVRRAFSPLLPEYITIRTPSPQPRPHAAPPIAHARDTIICQSFEMSMVIVSPLYTRSEVEMFKTTDQNARLELVSAIRLRSPFSEFLSTLRDMFEPINTTTNRFSTSYTRQEALIPSISSLSAQAKSDLLLHTPFPATTDFGDVVPRETMSNLATHGAHLFASLSRSLDIDKAFTHNFLSQACFILSNHLDMNGRNTRKLLDWVGVSAELTVLKSFFSTRLHTVAAVWESLLQSSFDLKHQSAFEVLIEVSFLIDRLDWINRRSAWILFSAVEIRSISTVKRLFNSGALPDNIDFTPDKDDTNLGYAAKTFQADMIRILVENGADVNLQFLPAKGAIFERFVDTALFALVTDLYRRKHLHHPMYADIIHSIGLLLNAGAEVDVESCMIRSFRNSSSDSQAQNFMASLGWYHGPNWLTDIVWFELGAGHEIVQTLMGNSNRARHYITVPGIITQARTGLANLNAYLQSRQFPSNAKDRIGLLEIAISEAAGLGCLETVTCLLQFGVDPNVGTLDREYSNWDPATRALRKRHYDIVQTLRENGANISLKRIIEISLYQHDFDSMLLVELSDADVLADGGPLILTFLEHADQKNFQVCAEMCDLLWSKGAPIDIRGYQERDPLHFAIFSDCCLEMCKYLVDRGYKVHSNQSIPTGTGTPSTMLRDAIKRTHSTHEEDAEEIIDFLLAHGAKIDLPNHSESLLRVTYAPYQDGPGRILRHPDDVHRVWKRKLRIFEKFLKFGDSVDASCGQRSWLDQVRILGPLIEKEPNDALVFRVIEATTDVDQQGAPLAMAISRRREAVVERLLSRGAKVNHPTDIDSLSVIGQACESLCSESMIERLIESGADVNNPPGSNPNAMKPLQVAASQGIINVACLLIKHGAEINAIHVDRHSNDRVTHYTALDFAASRGRLDMVQLLRDAGGKSANPGATGVEGAISRAEKYGHCSIADFLRSGRP